MNLSYPVSWTFGLEPPSVSAALCSLEDVSSLQEVEEEAAVGLVSICGAINCISMYVKRNERIQYLSTFNILMGFLLNGILNSYIALCIAIGTSRRCLLLFDGTIGISS